MHLTEENVVEIAMFAGEPSHYHADYYSLGAGAIIDFQTEEDEYSPSYSVRLRLEELESGTTGITDAPGNPPSKLFEATVLEATSEDFKEEGAAFGIIFPNGFASIVDGDPASDYAQRRLRAATAYSSGAGVGETLRQLFGLDVRN